MLSRAGRHPYLSLLIWMLVAAMAAYLVGVAVEGAEFRNYVVGNPVFVAVLAAIIAGTGTPPRISARHLLVIAATLALMVAMAFVALLMAEGLPGLAKVLAGPLTSIGAYPAGPDVWFPAGAALWFVTSFSLSIVACLAGTLIARHLRTRRNPQTD